MLGFSFFMINYLIQVREHLDIFAILKGVKEEFLESVVTDMIDEVSSSPLHYWHLVYLCWSGFLNLNYYLVTK